jgi:hypothetical protein
MADLPSPHVLARPVSRLHKAAIDPTIRFLHLQHCAPSNAAAGVTLPAAAMLDSCLQQ